MKNLSLEDPTLSDEIVTAPATVPAVRALRLVVDNTLVTPERRRTPRRQMVANYALERRAGDRRRRHPGIDGLLRMVLSDNWR